MNKKNIFIIFSISFLFVLVMIFVLQLQKNVSYKAKAALNAQKLTDPLPTVTPPADYQQIIFPNTGLALLLSGSNLPKGLADSIIINGLSSKLIYALPGSPGNFWYLVKGSRQFPPTSSNAYLVFYEPKKNIWLKLSAGANFDASLINNLSALEYYSGKFGIPNARMTPINWQGINYQAMEMPSFGTTLESYYYDYKIRGKGSLSFIEKMYQQGFDNAAELLVQKGIVLKDANLGNIAILNYSNKDIAIPFDFTTLSNKTSHPYSDELLELAARFDKYAQRLGLKRIAVSDKLLLSAMQKNPGYINFRVFLRDSLSDLSFVPFSNITHDNVAFIRNASDDYLAKNPNVKPNETFIVRDIEVAGSKVDIQVKVNRVIPLTEEKIAFSFSNILSRLNVLLLFLPSIIEFTPSGTVSLDARYTLLNATTINNYFIANRGYGNILGDIEESQKDMGNWVDNFVKRFINAGQSSAAAPNRPPGTFEFLSNQLLNNILSFETEKSAKDLYEEFFQYSIDYDRNTAKYKNLYYSDNIPPVKDQTAWLYQNILFLEAISDIIKTTVYPFPVFLNFNSGSPLDSGAYEYSKLSASKFINDKNAANIIFWTEKDSQAKVIKAIYTKGFLNKWKPYYFSNEFAISSLSNLLIFPPEIKFLCDIDMDAKDSDKTFTTETLFQVRCNRYPN